MRDLAFDAAGDSELEVVIPLDLTDLFCDEQRCHPVVGTLPVYFDKDHLTGTFARSLAHPVAERLASSLAR